VAVAVIKAHVAADANDGTAPGSPLPVWDDKTNQREKRNSPTKKALMAWVDRLGMLEVITIDTCLLKPRYNRPHEHFEG
jgi:hypothetical protein